MKIIKTKDVCEILNVKACDVYQFIKYDNLPHRKVLRNYRFLEESILQWKAEYDRQQEEINNALSEGQIASLLGCSIATVKKLVKTEGLPYIVNKWGRLLFVEERFWCWFLEKEQNKLAIEENHDTPETAETTKKTATQAGKAA